MRITFVCFGTRGDVTPCIALGIALRDVGHEVRVATLAEYEGLVRAHDLEFHLLSGSFEKLISTREGRSALGVPNASPLGLGAVLDPFRQCAEVVFSEIWAACADAEAIAASNVALSPAALVARLRGLPLIDCQAVPSIRTAELPQPAFPAWPLGGLYNRATYRLAGYIAKRGGWRVVQAWIEAARRLERQVPRPKKRARYLSLIAVSPVVVPRPADWPRHAHVTGYWFLPSASMAYQLPDDLRSFVEGGTPPICLGFGSMGDNDPVELRAIVLDALERLDRRAVIVGGSGNALDGFGDDDRVRSVRFVDYNLLFPRVGAVVHQGGAGTAASCLCAAAPQVCVPYCLDHRFWSGRMEQLGVAPRAVLRSRLTAPKLANMVRAALDEPRFRARAEQLAPIIRAEDGLGRAVDLIQRHLGLPTAAAPSVQLRQPILSP